MSTLQIVEHKNITKAGLESLFFVADAQENLVGTKLHKSREDAEQELAGLGGFSEGLEFAKAQFPDLGDKAHVGKANVIAEFLAWQQAGKPVKEAKVTGDEPVAEEEATVADEQPAPQAF